MADLFELFKKIAREPEGERTPIRYLIAGLGNPGTEYAHTRHNAGFLTMDYLCERLGTECSRIKFKSLVGEATLGGARVLLMKPQTYMNNSGEALREAADFYQIPPENVLVIFDDISLEPGRMRIRRRGSDGGHNGIKSIIRHLGSDNFPRIKLGVGKNPYPGRDLADWVLSNFTEEEQKLLFTCFSRALDAAALILQGEIEQAMNRYNQ